MLARPAARQFVGAVLPLILVAGAGCGAAKPENAKAPSSYLVVRAGPNGGEDVSPSERHAETAPDFLAVSSRLGVNLDRPELRHGIASLVMGHAALFGPAAMP